MTTNATTVLALLLLAPAGFAQEPAPVRLPEGVRVRVLSAVRGEGADGVFIRADESRITLALPAGDRYSWPGEITLQVEPTTRVQLYQGKRRHVLLGTAIGAVALGVLGASFTVDPGTCHDPNSTTFCSRGEAVGGGALVGAGIGAVVGYFLKTDRWSAPVRLARPPSLEPPGAHRLPQPLPPEPRRQ